MRMRRQDFLREQRLSLIGGMQEEQDEEDNNFISKYELDYDNIEQKLNSIISAGIQIVFINDKGSSFYPVLSFNVSKFSYKVQEEMKKIVGET